jgi:hypothetical protein
LLRWFDTEQLSFHFEFGSSIQLVGINNPLVPKTDTQETENLDKAIFS